MLNQKNVPRLSSGHIKPIGFKTLRFSWGASAPFFECTQPRMADPVSGLLLNGRSYRADCGAVSAAYAGLGVDNELILALGDSVYGALGCTCTAVDALIGNLVSHSGESSFKIVG